MTGRVSSKRDEHVLCPARSLMCWCNWLLHHLPRRFTVLVLSPLTRALTSFWQRLPEQIRAYMCVALHLVPYYVALPSRPPLGFKA